MGGSKELKKRGPSPPPPPPPFLTDFHDMQHSALWAYIHTYIHAYISLFSNIYFNKLDMPTGS